MSREASADDVEAIRAVIRAMDQGAFERSIHRAGVGQLNNCREHYYAAEFEMDVPEAEDMSFAPYDDCDDCIVREILLVTYPIIETWVREQFRREVLQLAHTFLDERDAERYTAAVNRE